MLEDPDSRRSFNDYKETDTLLKLSAEGVRSDDHNVGTKTLGNFYSFVFIINQIYGPGVLAIPIVFQQGKATLPLLSYSDARMMLKQYAIHVCILISKHRGLDTHYTRSCGFPYSIIPIFNSSMRSINNDTWK